MFGLPVPWVGYDVNIAKVKCVNGVILPESVRCSRKIHKISDPVVGHLAVSYNYTYYALPLTGGGIKRCFCLTFVCLSDVCLSVCRVHRA